MRDGKVLLGPFRIEIFTTIVGIAIVNHFDQLRLAVVAKELVFIGTGRAKDQGFHNDLWL